MAAFWDKFFWVEFACKRDARWRVLLIIVSLGRSTGQVEQFTVISFLVSCSYGSVTNDLLL